MLAIIIPIVAALQLVLRVILGWGSSYSDHGQTREEQQDHQQVIEDEPVPIIDWSSPAHGICTAYHQARVVLLATGTGTTKVDLTPVAHHLLGLDVSVWPFVPLSGLVQGFGNQHDAAVRVVADAYDSRTREAGTWNLNEGGISQQHDDMGRVIALAAEVMLNTAWRNTYLREVVPALSAGSVAEDRGGGGGSAGLGGWVVGGGGRKGRDKNSGKDGDDVWEAAGRARAMAQWCLDHGVTV